MLGIGHRYLVVGKEVGDNGTPHLQGYIEYGRAVRLGGVRRDIPRAHWEVRHGSALEASAYCKKDGDFHEDGELAGRQGRRTDLERVKELIDDGADDEKVAEEEFPSWVKFGKAFKAYRQMKLPKREWVMDVEVVWGPTGTGKSRYAATFEGAFWWTRDTGWNGYDGHDTVIMDDFEGAGDMPIGNLLRLLDRYPLQVRCLYGTAQFCAHKIVITSHSDVDGWGYPADRLPEILRRVVQVRRLG